MVSNMMHFRYNIVAASDPSCLVAPGPKALPGPGPVLGPKYGTQALLLKTVFTTSFSIRKCTIL